MRRIPCWLSRQRNGLYMLTQHKPIKKNVGRTNEEDLYVLPGDGIGYRHMCAWSAERIFGVQLELLESIRVWMLGGRL